jgi:glycyl-tRNA synthetase
LTFQADVGSMLDKVKRLEKISPEVAEMLDLNDEETEEAVRAASLCKADLASSLVVEMTSLQGIMGGHYARLGGESEAVALAIAEQYQSVSLSRPGLVLALSDRLDSLLGLFAVGLAPKGSNDPYALRRAAIQIIENLVANEIDFDLRLALKTTAKYLPVEVSPEKFDQVLRFISSRLETFLQEQGIRTSVVRAVLAEQGHNPYPAALDSAALNDAVKAETWSALLDAYARCVRITRERPDYELDPEQLILPEEKNLWSAYLQAEELMNGTVAGLIEAISFLQPTIAAFFDGVLVMDEDATVRQNRLALVQKIAGIAGGIADLSHLEGF